MALIKCPECKKKISDQCENCPQCGYPIKDNLQRVNTEDNTKETVVLEKKPFYKNEWIWIVAGVVLIGLILGVVFLLAHDTKPKLDNEGKPVFVELTNEVYTNAKKYKGYHINIKGKVFQVIGDNGKTKGIQIWIDPDTCEQNMMIYYNTDVDVKQGEYIICSGYIDSVSKYKNAYGATLYAPLVISSDLKQATYIEVMAPATAIISPENLKQEKLGYAISVDKVEFSEKETRVYVTATNKGKAKMYFGEVVVVQDGKQYKETSNFEADYTEIPYEIVTGASSSGIVVFPAMPTHSFELTIDVHSDDYEENLGEFAFVIQSGASGVKGTGEPTETITPTNLKQEKYGYAISIDKVELYKEETLVYLTVSNNGATTLCVDADGAVIVQDGKQYNTKPACDTGSAKIPCEIVKGAYSSGIIAFPAINSNDFELIIDVHSDNAEEELGRTTILIGKGKTEIITPWPVEPTYPSAVGEYCRYVDINESGMNYAYFDTVYIYADGTLYREFVPEDNTIPAFAVDRGTWTQEKNVICYNLYSISSESLIWNNPFYDTVYETGIDFLGEYFVGG